MASRSASRPDRPEPPAVADDEPGDEDVERAVLREQARLLRSRLEERERELRATREWAQFLGEEVESYRARAERLERRVERLERDRGLLGRLRALFR